MRRIVCLLALTLFINLSAFSQAESANYSSEKTKKQFQRTSISETNSTQKQNEELSSFARTNDEIPMDGLVGYYKLNNSSYIDSSPSGFDLELGGIGGALLTEQNRFGEPDKALRFLNEYLNLASNPGAFDFAGGNISISVWIKIQTDIIDWTGLANNWAGFGVGGYYFGVTPTQQIRWNVNGDFPADTDPIPTGEWIHIVVTYDGIDANVWLNGALAQSESNNVPILGSSFPFSVGAQADVTTNQFPGIIDDVLVYDRVLTGPEIQDIFTVLSIEDIDLFSSQIRVYPNPSSSLVTITYDNTLGTIKSFRIVDSQGRIVANDLFKSSETTIDLNAIASGIYLLHLQTNDGISIAKKIIKN